MAEKEGVKISEFPTTMIAATSARDHGLKILMGAPNLILGGSHSGNVAAMELAKAGLLDILASDYVPESLLQEPSFLTGSAIFRCREQYQ